MHRDDFQLLILFRRVLFGLCCLFSFLAPLATHGQSISTVAGTGAPTFNGNSNPPLKINIGDPFGVEVGPDQGFDGRPIKGKISSNALYITEVRNHRILRLDPDRKNVITVAGTGKKGNVGDGGQATDAMLNEPYEVRFDRVGNMYFVEMQNHQVRFVDRKTGKIRTIAGTGKSGFGGDGGPAIKATFNRPHSIALDHQGGLYIADIGNHRIRRVDLETGIVTTFAGNGKKQLPTEGIINHEHPLIGPRALFIDGKTMWIALREGHSVWKLDLDSREISHVAGTGKKGFSGDGGDPKKATFNGPKGIAVGPMGNIFVVDTENQVIRKIDLKQNRIETVAGQGPKHRGGGGDGGLATSAEMARPHGLCVDSTGAIYVGDTLNHRVRRIGD